MSQHGVVIRAAKQTKRREFNSNQPTGVVLNKKEIKSFRGLAMEHRNAEYLYLRENLLEKFDPYIVLENLKVLDLSINELSGTVDFLANCPFLRHLYLTGNRITSLSGICNLNNLETLCLSDNAISSFDGLDALPNLRVLSLNFNNIASFRSFPYLPSLHTLNLVGNPLVELASYRSMAVALCAPTLVSIDGVAVEESERTAVLPYAGKVVYCISEGFIVESQDMDKVQAAANQFLMSLQRDTQKSMSLQLSSIRLASSANDEKSGNNAPVEGVPVRLDACLQDVRPFKTRQTDTFFSRFLFPVEFKVHGNASEAFVVGSMNGWSDPLPLERVEEGEEVTFQTTLYLPAGVHEYRYIVDGQIRAVENPGQSKYGQGLCNFYHVAQAQTPEEDQETILHIRWMRSDENNGFVLIDDENTLTYTPTQEDIGFSLRSEVLAYVRGEFAFLYFDISAPVVAGPPTCTRLEIKGNCSEGDTLVVEADYTGGEEGTSSLAWYRVLSSGEEIPLVVDDPWAGYTLTLDDVGSRIKAIFTPVRNDWNAGEPRNTLSDPIAAGIPVCRSIRITGQPEESCLLTAETVYSGGTEGTSRFQWFRREDDDSYLSIAGETKSEYTPTLEDVGKWIAVEYTPVSQDGIIGEPVRCILEQPIEAAPPQILSIAIRGELEEQHVLIVEYKYYGGHGGAHLISWQRRDAAKRCTKIGRSNTSTCTTTVSEVGCLIDVTVTPVRSDGVAGKPVTASTDAVIRPGFPQVKAIQITGEPLKGCVLEIQTEYFGGEQGDSIIEWSREVPETRHFDVIAKKTKKYVVQHEDLGRMLKISYTPVRRDGVAGETKTRLVQIPAEVPDPVEVPEPPIPATTPAVTVIPSPTIVPAPIMEPVVTVVEPPISASVAQPMPESVAPGMVEPVVPVVIVPVAVAEAEPVSPHQVAVTVSSPVGSPQPAHLGSMSPNGLDTTLSSSTTQ